MTASVEASSAKKIAVGNVQAIHAMLSMASASIHLRRWCAPSPRSYGEWRRRPAAAGLPSLKNADAKHRLWVRGCLHTAGLGERPPHPDSPLQPLRPSPP